MSHTTQEILDRAVEKYENPDFITEDPISIPHSYTRPQDIEISGLFASILAWGNRTTIIKKCKELMHRMDNAPHEFILYHTEADLKGLLGFKHRTFQDTDLLYFVDFLQRHYKQSESLETAFLPPALPASADRVGKALVHFEGYFTNAEYFPTRTRKHVSTPARASACKRLNMYLRWMVRSPAKGVDFGLWQTLLPADLVCPCDVHVGKVAEKYQLISRPATDWKTALELTQNLQKFDAQDPIKYDFALFGIGRYELKTNI